MTAGRRIRVAGLWAALAGTLALLSAGCGRCGCSSEEGTRGPADARAPGATEQVEQAQGKPALPESGKAVVEVSERGVTVLANAAPRVEVLQLLEKQAGFRLVLGRLRRPVPVTMWAVELPLEAVLSQLLEGVAYESHYRADPERGGHVLAAVAVGAQEDERGKSIKDRFAKRKQGRDQRQRDAEERWAKLSPEDRERARERRAEEREQRAAERREQEAQIVRDIQDRDARVRAEAARKLATDEEGARRLRELLAQDPSPEVRAAAAQQLATDSSFATAEAMLQSLNDPNPEVVIAVLEVLAFVGDASMAPQVRNLLNHPDPGVRAAAKGALPLLD